MIITSKSNKVYKFVESLKKKKYRILENQYVVEGINPVKDAIKAGAHIHHLCVSEQFSTQENMNDFSSYETYVMKDEIFAGMCSTVNPQGILACIYMDKKELAIKDNGFYLYCDGVNDPGNAGTIIRIADACGLDGVLFSQNSVDIYSDKTIRASMGSFFHLPILDHMEPDWLKNRKKEGFHIVGGILDNESMPYTKAPLQTPLVIVVGNEANGISEPVKEICTHKAIIPIYGEAESLNVAIAAALLCYEVRNRQEGDR